MILALAWLRAVPSWAWAALACLVLAGGLYVKGRSDGKAACQRAQAAAEARLDRKAAAVAKVATERTEKARKIILQRNEDAADAVRDEMASVGCDQPLPARVRDELGESVRRAREALPAD